MVVLYTLFRGILNTKKLSIYSEKKPEKRNVHAKVHYGIQKKLKF